ncbi:MAG: hypothetical protein HYZ00_03390 [Candidatus Hydrogenedentes bacterium]|nr:hypothetical protein [Candidatus Hydrogenedentota bacterium]
MRRPVTELWQLQLVAAAIVASNVVHVGAALILNALAGLPVQGAPADAAHAQLLTGVFLASGVAIVAASFAVMRLLRAKLARGASLPAIVPAVVVPMAMAEASGAISLVAVILTGNWLAAGVLWGLAIGAGIIHFPTRGWVESIQEP